MAQVAHASGPVAVVGGGQRAFPPRCQHKWLAFAKKVGQRVHVQDGDASIPDKVHVHLASHRTLCEGACLA